MSPPHGKKGLGLNGPAASAPAPASSCITTSSAARPPPSPSCALLPVCITIGLSRLHHWSQLPIERKIDGGTRLAILHPFSSPPHAIPLPFNTAVTSTFFCTLFTLIYISTSSLGVVPSSRRRCFRLAYSSAAIEQLPVRSCAPSRPSAILPPIAQSQRRYRLQTTCRFTSLKDGKRLSGRPRGSSLRPHHAREPARRLNGTSRMLSHPNTKVRGQTHCERNGF
jgi:hypothetical protein